MLNIEISVDFENVIDSDEFFEINNVSDYVEGYKKIQESIYNKESLSVVLRNKFCLRAFKKMQELYGKDKIKIKHYNYRQKLEHELQFKIPESILDSELKNYKLLNNIDDYKLDKYNNFNNFLLGNILNEYFGNKEFPIINILDFYDKINFDLIEKRKDDELFKKIFKEKIDKWKERISGELKQKTFNFFLSEPKTLYKNLATYNLIYKYPRSVKEKIIKDRYLFLEKLNFKKDNKIRKNVNEKQVKTILKEYLNKTKKNKILEDKESLNFLSGNFKIELDFILDVLETQKKLQKKEIIDEIKYKFTDIMNSEYLN